MESKFKKCITKNLRRYIAEKNLTQQQFADAVGVSKGSVNHWVNGSQYPTLSKLESICKVMHCQISDLIDVEV